MFIDASALVSIIVHEDDYVDLLRKVDEADDVMLSAMTLYEAATAVSRITTSTVGNASRVIQKLANERDAVWVDIDADIGRAALEAFDRYGKGRHKAGLNMGDCFSYACARVHDLPLLYKGDDFSLTDIKAA